MTSDPAVTNPVKSPLAAISLKLVGLITILSALLDYFILIIPPNLANPQWQLATTTQMVDRGIVPLVGIALLLTGFWIDSSVGRSRQFQSLTTDLRFWVCALASLLGLIYLLLAIFHVNAVRMNSRTALEQVSSEASQATSQLEQRLSTELSQQQNQLGAILQNEELLAQAIQAGQLPQELEQFRDDPEGLTQFLQQQADQTRQEIQTQIGTRREEAERRVRTEAWKSGLRISISSLLLAVGYIIVGWSGLKRLMALT
jgi:ABC-type multidrug transport system fused ATPase/permease subunit